MISAVQAYDIHDLEPCAWIQESCSAPGVLLSPEEAQQQADEAEPVLAVA
jgi:hypothetical protein